MSDSLTIIARIEVVVDTEGVCGGECEYAGAEQCLLFRKKRRKVRGSAQYQRLKGCRDGETNAIMSAELGKAYREAK